MALDVRGTTARRFWLVLERGVGSSICISDPCLSEERYVHVEADAADLYPIARVGGDGPMGSPMARSAGTATA